MPTSVLEKDKQGQPTLRKIVEARGNAALQPWNNPKRILIAKERNKRSKRRRQQQEKNKRSGGKEPANKDGADNSASDNDDKEPES